MLLKLAKFGELELWDSLLGMNSDIMGLAPCNKNMVKFTIFRVYSNDKYICFISMFKWSMYN